MGIIKPHDPRLIRFARENRKVSTLSETQLWHELRGQKLGGVKFRRQHVFEPFVLDFYAPMQKLAIEVDGDFHDDVAHREHDRSRQQQLEAQGIRVLRFSHDRVIHDMENVLGEIAVACGIQREDLHQTPPLTPPASGRGIIFRNPSHEGEGN